MAINENSTPTAQTIDLGDAETPSPKPRRSLGQSALTVTLLVLATMLTILLPSISCGRRVRFLAADARQGDGHRRLRRRRVDDRHEPGAGGALASTDGMPTTGRRCPAALSVSPSTGTAPRSS